MFEYISLLTAAAPQAENLGIPTEIICALITVAGVVISALISWRITVTTLNREKEKMKLSWDREDIVSSEEEFGEMASAVAKYTGDSNYTNHLNALSKVASVRAKENGELAMAMDDLYQAIFDRKYSLANAKLSAAISKKREAKQKTKARK